MCQAVAFVVIAFVSKRQRAARAYAALFLCWPAESSGPGALVPFAPRQLYTAEPFVKRVRARVNCQKKCARCVVARSRSYRSARWSICALVPPLLTARMWPQFLRLEVAGPFVIMARERLCPPILSQLLSIYTHPPPPRRSKCRSLSLLSDGRRKCFV